MESRRLHAGEERSFRHGIYMGSGTPLLINLVGLPEQL